MTRLAISSRLRLIERIARVPFHRRLLAMELRLERALPVPYAELCCHRKIQYRALVLCVRDLGKHHTQRHARHSGEAELNRATAMLYLAQPFIPAAELCGINSEYVHRLVGVLQLFDLAEAEAEARAILENATTVEEGEHA